MELKDYLKLNKIQEKDMAQDLKINPGHLSFIVRGKRWPGYELALEIVKYCKEEVTLDDLFKDKPKNKVCPTCGKRYAASRNL